MKILHTSVPSLKLQRKRCVPLREAKNDEIVCPPVSEIHVNNSVKNKIGFVEIPINFIKFALNL